MLINSNCQLNEHECFISPPSPVSPAYIDEGRLQNEKSTAKFLRVAQDKRLSSLLGVSEIIGLRFEVSFRPL